MATAPLPLTTTDLVCLDDLDPYGNETTSDLQNLVQDIFHILKEMPGSNPDDPKRGIGVETFLGGTVASLASLPGRVEAQLGEDDRIDSVSCTVSQADENFVLHVSIGVAGTVVPLQFGWTDGQFTHLTP